MIETELNVAVLLDTYLREKREAEGEREIVGGATWRASKLGGCLKEQYMKQILKMPSKRDFDGVTLRNFERGHMWGNMFTEWFEKMGFLLEDEVEMCAWDIGAHADHVLGAEGHPFAGLEIKTMHPFVFQRVKDKGETALFEHLIQTAAYDLLYRETQGIEIPWYVVSVNAADLFISQAKVEEGHRLEAARRIMALNNAKEFGIVPECTCQTDWMNGRGWKYCDYGPGKKGKEPKECCVIEEAA